MVASISCICSICTRRFTLMFKSAAIALLLLLTGCAMQSAPAISHDGLELVDAGSLDTVYRRPGVNLGEYNRFIVGDCSVAFRKHWQRDQNSTSRGVNSRISDEDMENTKARLGKLCHEIFVEELTRDGGYPVVDTAGVDVLELRPAIVDLDINAPDTFTAGRSRSYTTSAGGMTLYLESFDSLTGEIVGRVIDKRKAPENFELQWTNSVTNTRDAKRILRLWGSRLRDMADNARH